ncbi:hypothetical protein PoB_002986000 [Plakobranchus ocellatus]|uniref:Uncharacterized protein n=1 Tax=Plakobranchus ocellatus TaxID=259542 RepID=A0AAV4A5C6_9GAST|nr:hypothetical protein PoB_002986000 [Plakobranchus ocellatus]
MKINPYLVLYQDSESISLGHFFSVVFVFIILKQFESETSFPDHKSWFASVGSAAAAAAASAASTTAVANVRAPGRCDGELSSYRLLEPGLISSLLASGPEPLLSFVI